MSEQENILSRLKQALSSHKFWVWLLFSLLITIGFTYLANLHEEVQEYKQAIFWYENLEKQTQQTKTFEDFVKQAQEKLRDDYSSYFKFPRIPIIDDKIGEKIIVVDNAPPGKSIPWKIEKTGESVEVYYDFTKVNDFNTLCSSSDENSNNREEEKLQSRNDEVFQKFTHLVVNKISKPLDKNKNDGGVDNLRNFSELVIDYLANDQDYSKLIPALRINNIYITNTRTGFLLSYPATNKTYKDTCFKERPWFKATLKKSDLNSYHRVFDKKDENENYSGLSGVYIDLDEEYNPNVVRDLFYKFKYKGTEYILCFDLFLDQSS